MIPLRLQLRNFMCYGEGVPPLILEGVHVACLSGENGHGKSALLDAITWALWGRGRGKSDDDLVQIGKTEMEVDLEFAISDVRYRVIRKRALKGRRGVPALELQVRGDEGYRPITGNTVHETQRKLNAVLHMEYETFINSALLLQGRADEFTVKPPVERKRVLADVLGLGVYDELEERARQLAREAEQKRRELVVALADIGRELEMRPEYLTRRDRVAADLEAVGLQLAAQEAALLRARAAKSELDRQSIRVAELRQRRERTLTQLAQSERQIAADRTDLAVSEAVLADRESIDRGYRRLLALRDENELLARAASELLSLQQQRGALERSIATARTELESEIRIHTGNLAAVHQKAAQRPISGAELTNVLQQLEMLAGLEAHRDKLRESLHRLRAEIDRLKMANERLKEEINLIKQKLDVLGGDGASCPVCGNELGQAGRGQLEHRFRLEGKQHADEHRANTLRIKELETRGIRDQQEVVALERQLSEQERLRRRAGALEQSLRAVDEAEREAAELTRVVEQLRDRLCRGDYAGTEQERLAKLAGEIEGLGYDPAKHDDVRRELDKVAVFEGRWAEVQMAETVVELLREKVRQNEETIEQQRQTIAELDDELGILAKQVASGSRVLAELVEAEDRVDALGKTSAELRLQLGRCEQILSHCAFLEDQRREKVAAQERAATEKGIYDDLSLAFGKKGIQAMIIDAAIPEIEDEANVLLARLTDNRMHVKFETQREAKSNDGVIETLDIKIADELGYRQYEMYSGGEAFRVNFAIRIALSKLLARRAGARLQTLIIDEGFGTQDVAGRERLVEAINGISEEFECILAITHIQELKDAFPIRIDVVKTPEGSQIQMSG